MCVICGFIYETDAGIRKRAMHCVKKTDTISQLYYTSVSTRFLPGGYEQTVTFLCPLLHHKRLISHTPPKMDVAAAAPAKKKRIFVRNRRRRRVAG